MRVVIDTNIVVSGLLWHGPPRQVLDAAREGIIELYTSEDLLAELDDVLGRGKFAARLLAARVTVAELVLGYSVLAHLIEPYDIGSVVLADADDDAVLACALAAQAEVIVSGD